MGAWHACAAGSKVSMARLRSSRLGSDMLVRPRLLRRRADEKSPICPPRTSTPGGSAAIATAAARAARAASASACRSTLMLSAGVIHAGLPAA